MSPLTEPTRLTLAKSFTWNETVWNPSMIQTALWLDAADSSTITADGSNLISQVNDKSGKSRHLTSSGVNRPTFTASGQNGRGVITFNGEHRLSAATASDWTFLHSSTSSVFMVCRVGSSSNPNAAYFLYSTRSGGATGGMYFVYDDRASTPANNRVSIEMRGTGFLTFASNESSDGYLEPNTVCQLSLLSDIANPTAASKSQIRLNAGSPVANNTFTNTQSPSSPTYALVIGAPSSSLLYVGFIAEFVVTSFVADTVTRQKMEGYLAHKWGLAANLPSNHPYKTVGPTP